MYCEKVYNDFEWAYFYQEKIGILKPLKIYYILPNILINCKIIAILNPMLFSWFIGFQFEWWLVIKIKPPEKQLQAKLFFIHTFTEFQSKIYKIYKLLTETIHWHLPRTTQNSLKGNTIPFNPILRSASTCTSRRFLEKGFAVKGAAPKNTAFPIRFSIS